MSIQDCFVTTTTTFQVLDPVNEAPPGSTVGQYVEEGLTTLTVGSALKTITFLTTKASADYMFDEFVIINTVDANKLNLTAEVTEQLAAEFKIQINANPDTANYKLKWAVRIPT